MRISMRALRLTLAAAAWLVSAGAIGQTWPAKAVRVVVAYPAGSAADAMTRVMTTRMSVTLGQPIVVENRPGANANLGIEAVAKASPDGYTLLTSGGYVLTNQMLEAGLRWQPADLAPVSRFTVGINFVVAPASLAAKSLREFIQYAKANPGLPFADAGAAAPQTLGLEMLKTVAGLKVVQVTYKGGPLIIPDLINGAVNVAILPSNVALSSLRSGRLKALANTGEKRSALFPDVPTIAEEGYGAATVVSWQGFHVPSGTASEVIQKIAELTAEAAANGEVKSRIENAGGEVAFLGTRAFQEFLQEDAARWKLFMQTIPRK
jgi:tripartite-type tricarboxylate transporter receptor subunit TctC